MNDKIRCRFAPSPTGFMHVGNLRTALYAYLAAKAMGGKFILRIEDTDQKRFVEGATEVIYNTLKTCGINWDEGPDVGGNCGPYVQSERANIYKVVIKYMLENNMAYPCFCTPEELSEMRKSQEAIKDNFGYFGKYAIERIQNGENFVIRFRSTGDYHNKVAIDDAIRGHIEMAENDQHIVIYKSDGLPTYHFAHLVDDHFMHTTHVTRGEEWMPSLPIHIELFNAMNWQAPTYAHVPVIMKLDNGNRRKLSKRKDLEAAVSFFLEQGYPIEGFMEYLYTIANSNYEAWRDENKDADKDDFKFSFDKMSLDGALFDLQKVQFLCKEKLGHMNTKTFAANATKWAEEYNQELYNLIQANPEFFAQIVGIEREKENPRKDYEKYSDILPLIKFFYNEHYNEMVNDIVFPENVTMETVKTVLTEYVKVFDLSLSEEDWFAQMKEVAVKCGFASNAKEFKKNRESFLGHVGDVAAILRMTITLRLQSPNLYFVMKILGTEEVARRIENIIKK